MRYRVMVLEARDVTLLLQNDEGKAPSSLARVLAIFLDKVYFAYLERLPEEKNYWEKRVLAHATPVRSDCKSTSLDLQGVLKVTKYNWYDGNNPNDANSIQNIFNIPIDDGIKVSHALYYGIQWAGRNDLIAHIDIEKNSSPRIGDRQTSNVYEEILTVCKILPFNKKPFFGKGRPTYSQPLIDEMYKFLQFMMDIGRNNISETSRDGLTFDISEIMTREHNGKIWDYSRHVSEDCRRCVENITKSIEYQDLVHHLSDRSQNDRCSITDKKCIATPELRPQVEEKQLSFPYLPPENNSGPVPVSFSQKNRRTNEYNARTNENTIVITYGKTVIKFSGQSNVSFKLKHGGDCIKVRSNNNNRTARMVIKKQSSLNGRERDTKEIGGVNTPSQNMGAIERFNQALDEYSNEMMNTALWYMRDVVDIAPQIKKHNLLPRISSLVTKRKLSGEISDRELIHLMLVGSVNQYYLSRKRKQKR